MYASVHPLPYRYSPSVRWKLYISTLHVKDFHFHRDQTAGAGQCSYTVTVENGLIAGVIKKRRWVLFHHPQSVPPKWVFHKLRGAYYGITLIFYKHMAILQSLYVFKETTKAFMCLKFCPFLYLHCQICSSKLYVIIFSPKALCAYFWTAKALWAYWPCAYTKMSVNKDTATVKNFQWKYSIQTNKTAEKVIHLISVVKCYFQTDIVKLLCPSAVSLCVNIHVCVFVIQQVQERSGNVMLWSFWRVSRCPRTRHGVKFNITIYSPPPHTHFRSCPKNIHILLLS